MRRARVGRILSRMDSRSITITLELDVAGESLTGSATDGTGAARTFSGWLGLVTALDRFVNAGPAVARQEDDRD